MTVSNQSTSPGQQIEQPGKLIRIASMAQAMLVEARSTPCDRAGCERFLEIYERTLHELNDVLPEELRAELADLALTFSDPSPTASELRVAQAELVGWLEGVFNGIAAASSVGEQVAEEELVAIVEMPGQYL